MKWLSTVSSLLLLTPVALSLKFDCQCPCECLPDGRKLKNLINCFSTWGDNVATDSNSFLRGCNETDVVHCRIPTAEDHFCKFDGTNNLVDEYNVPKCYYNCGMQSCNAFLIAHTIDEVHCIANVFKDQ